MKPALKPPKHTDELGRRHRTKPQSVNKPLILTPRLLDYLETVRRARGPVPALMTFDAWSRDGSGQRYFPQIMTRLVHERVKLPDGTMTEGPLLIRPGALNPDKGVKAQPAWIMLSEEGEAIAAEHAGYTVGHFQKRDPLHHRGMSASLNLTQYLLAPEHGMQELDLSHIVSHQNCPERTRAMSNPLVMTTSRGNLEPDALFGFKYQTGFRFFAREDSRRTEPLSRSVDTKEKQQSEIEKILKYEEVLDRAIFRSHFGLPNLRIMWCMTSKGRKDRLLNFLKDRKHGNKHVIKVFNRFSTEHWDAYREPIEDYFTPWETIDGPFDITRV